MSNNDPTLEFGRAWERDGPRLAAYARRHVPPDDVGDVVAETFLQAWRRWPDVPHPPIGWLIGTARKVIGNQRRSYRRREALHDRLVLLDAAATSAADAGMVATERMAALEALACLPDPLREAVLLVSWDGLTSEEAAAVLGISAGNFRVRAHRARKVLTLTSTTNTFSEPLVAARTVQEGGLR
jgi:RNA polymerase sigma factor (sigma-70 family)